MEQEINISDEVINKIKSDYNQDQTKVEEKPKKKEINFQEMPSGTNEILNNKTQQDIIDRFTKDEPVSIPMEGSSHNSYLNLVLSPNLRELELMIRGLEYIKRFNPLTGKDEVILKKIEGHPLNEYGINTIMNELKIFTSPEIKLGRKRPRDHYNSVQHVCRSIVRLIYKNLKNFGMDTQVKQRNAKSYCDAIIEIVDASFSRSIEGKENDLSRATEFRIESNIDGLNDPASRFNKAEKEKMKN